jgi:hypothetical protein
MWGFFNKELFLMYLFRHPAAVRVMYLKMLPAAVCHLLRKRRRNLGSFAYLEKANFMGVQK